MPTPHYRPSIPLFPSALSVTMVLSLLFHFGMQEQTKFVNKSIAPQISEREHSEREHVAQLVAKEIENDLQQTMAHIERFSRDLDIQIQAGSAGNDEFVRKKDARRNLHSIMNHGDAGRNHELVMQALESRRAYAAGYRVVRNEVNTHWLYEHTQGIYSGDLVVAIQGVITDTTPEDQIDARTRGLKNVVHDIEFRDGAIGFYAAGAAKLCMSLQRVHREEKLSGTGIGPARGAKILQWHDSHMWVNAAVDQDASFF